MRILYLVGGENAFWGGATVRDAAFMRGLAAGDHEVLGVSVFGPAPVDGEDGVSPFFPLGQGRLKTMFPRLTRVPSTLAGFLKKPRPVTNLTAFAVDGYVDRAGPEVVNLLAGRDKQLRRDFARLLEYLRAKEFRPDVVILSNIMLSGLAEPLKGALGCRLVCLTQGSDRIIENLYDPYRSDARKLARKNARLMSMVVTTSRYFAIRTTEFLALPPNRVRVVYPGIDVERLRNPHPRVRDPFVIGFLSPISNRTGLDILVDALDSLVKNTQIRPQLWIAGPVEDERYWHRILRRLDAAHLKGSHRVFGPLTLKQRREFFPKLSVFAVACREPESKGVIILEAMAMGVPVVGPSCGIIPEIFQYANGGLLVSSESPVWMYSQTFELLATIPETADQMGQVAVEGVAEHFSIERSTAQLIDLLAEATRKPV